MGLLVVTKDEVIGSIGLVGGDEVGVYLSALGPVGVISTIVKEVWLPPVRSATAIILHPTPSTNGIRGNST